ncbi:MAG: hypothetical protein PVI90_18660 [Desulfobacteraceae bacterium]|jgi:hypothetical protein
MSKPLKITLIIGIVANVVLWSLVVFGQIWVATNQKIVGWDAVTTNIEGDPIPADNSIEYVAYLANAITDPDKTNPAEIATINETQYIVTLTSEGKYFFGVKAVRKDANGEIVGESEIAWSDDARYAAAGQTFGLQHFLPPAAPTGLAPTD